MVGLIHLVLVDLINDIAGEDGLIKILELADIDTTKEFKINQIYNDEEWGRFFKSALQVLNITEEQAYDAYADKFFQFSYEKFNTFYKISKNSYEFICRQPRIHNGFAMGIAQAEDRNIINDKFKIDAKEDSIITHYKSPNKLCSLYKSLARRIIQHYDDSAHISDVKCMHNGDDECEIHIHWSK